MENRRERWKNAQNYNIEDICYIYYTNLPDGTSRILLRAKVCASDTDKDVVDNIYSYNEKSKIKGIRLSNIKAIALDEPELFNKNKLSTEYNKSNIQGQQYLGDIPYEGSKEKELIKALEKCPNKKILKLLDLILTIIRNVFSVEKIKKVIQLSQVVEDLIFMNAITLF